MKAATPASFAALLEAAVTEPGIISDAYRQFHNYSFGNQLHAVVQCAERGIALGPLATFQRWRDLGRHVKRGEKALTLCMPVTVKRPEQSGDGTEREVALTRFVYRPRWFVLAQTEGQELAPMLPPSWDRAQALGTLDVEEVPFDLTDGNCPQARAQRML